MIELYITMTGKSFARDSKFAIFADERKSFATKRDAMRWLREQYGKAKRSAMYVDTKDGKSKRIGYVIGFRNADYSHAPVQHWIQQDWIEFREVKTLDLDRSAT